jgi:methylglutaconyl-CoA hydratase
MLLMTHLIQKIQDHVCWLTLNRPEKNNAFDEFLIEDLTGALKHAIENEAVRVIVLKGEGKHFSAGADLKWMQRIAQAGYADNEKDALRLAELLSTLHHCPKPTLAQVHGVAYGGGVGLLAACDIVIAESNAQFCFSEVKLGLIPAVISPYVVQAIGPRVAKRLFMTGEVFSAAFALKMNLIHEVVESPELYAQVSQLAQQLAHLPVEAVKGCKSLVGMVTGHPLDSTLMQKTAKLIAEKRGSNEAQKLMKAFLEGKK